MDLVLTTPPAVEPVTLVAAKDHLRILHATEDALINRVIRAVRMHVEKRLGRALIQQGWTMRLDRFPASGEIAVPKPPLIAVTEVTYVDRDGEVQTLDPDAYQEVRGPLSSRIVRRGAWPATARNAHAVEITFTAGYGAEPTDVPDDLAHAMLLLIEHFYHNRGETGDGPITVNPVASERLLGPFMTHGWI